MSNARKLNRYGKRIDVAFRNFLTVMAQAYELVEKDPDSFRELENRIIREIKHHRKVKVL